MEAEEIEDVGVTEDEVGSELVGLFEGGEFFGDEVFGLFADGGAFEEEGIDAFLEGAGTPAFEAGHFGVEGASEGVFDVDEDANVGPR